jgi:hypothetical protein
VNMSDELKERNILKLILIVRFACATLDMGHPICMQNLLCFGSPEVFSVDKSKMRQFLISSLGWTT